MSEELRTGRLIPDLTEMFRLQAWIALGKVASPVSGKVERDLATARTMIDLLAELENRTEGHRSSEESKLLRGALTDLRLNYLEEQKKPVEPQEDAKAAPEAGPAGEPAPEGGADEGPDEGPDEPAPGDGPSSKEAESE
jgi:hypothetical protein